MFCAFGSLEPNFAVFRTRNGNAVCSAIGSKLTYISSILSLSRGKKSEKVKILEVLTSDLGASSFLPSPDCRVVPSLFALEGVGLGRGEVESLKVGTLCNRPPPHLQTFFPRAVKFGRVGAHG